MLVMLARHDVEVIPEFVLQTFRRIALDGKTTAATRTILGECRYQHVAAGTNGMAYLRNISLASFRSSEKVKRRAIMPHIEARWRQLYRQHIRLEPFDQVGITRESLPRLSERGTREIEDGDVVVAGVEETVDQRRGPRTHVDDR